MLNLLDSLWETIQNLIEVSLKLKSYKCIFFFIQKGSFYFVKQN